ncbi:MAG: hypothetical protein ABW167_15150 [Baekduia sp.]
MRANPAVRSLPPWSPIAQYPSKTTTGTSTEINTQVLPRRTPAQLYRRRIALKLLEGAGSPQHVLDIGSGLGDFLANGR